MNILTISKNDSGQRLDKFLTKALPTLPPPLMYKAIRTKKIKLNRKRCEASDILNVGDTIQCFISPEFFSPTAREENFMHITPRLCIVYEDENILICDKAPGIVCHSDKNNNTDTLIDHIKAYLYKKGDYKPQKEQSFTPALCNRIDRNTGGIVLAAKNANALRELNLAIREGRVEKQYLCVVKGVPNPTAATLHGWLVKDSKNNEVKISDNRPTNTTAAPKEIITKYKTLKAKNNLSLLEIDLITGRTHQIRAHLSHIGYPLFGDGKYGINKNDKITGLFAQALYSYRVTFNFECGELSYLNKKSFEVKSENIKWLSLYE